VCETGQRRDHSMVGGDHSVKNTGCTVAATRMPLLTVARVYASRTLGLDRHRFRTEPTRDIDVELCGAIPTLFVLPENVLRSTVPDQVQIQIARLSGPRQLRACFVLDSCAVHSAAWQWSGKSVSALLGFFSGCAQYNGDNLGRTGERQ
jgi:hypothetical protein